MRPGDDRSRLTSEKTELDSISALCLGTIKKRTEETEVHGGEGLAEVTELGTQIGTERLLPRPRPRPGPAVAAAGLLDAKEGPVSQDFWEPRRG